MSVDSVQESIDAIRHTPAGSCWFVGERPEQLVVAAEDALGFSLPSSYRRFVLALGAGSVSGEEIYGVVNDDFVSSAVPNGVWLTLDVREAWGLPESMLVVYFDGGVDYYVMNCALDDPPLALWRPGITTATDELAVVAGDFGSFLAEIVQREL